jgi:hypothetical protein
MHADNDCAQARLWYAVVCYVDNGIEQLIVGQTLTNHIDDRRIVANRKSKYLPNVLCDEYAWT